MTTLTNDRITIGDVRRIKDPVKRASKAFAYLEQSMQRGLRETVGFCREGFDILQGELDRVSNIAIVHPEHSGDN